MSGLKDLAKQLNGAFSAAVPVIDGNVELQDVIRAYIQKHTPPSESDRSKLQEELLSLYKAHVTTAKTPNFLKIIGLFKHDFIVEPEACAKWWDLLLFPLLDHHEALRQTMQMSKEICLDILVFPEDDPSFKTRHAAAQTMKSRIYKAYFSALDQQQRHVSDRLELLLLSFARRRAKDFFDSIDEYICDTKRRLQSMTLLSMFVRLQTQYVYQIYDTPLLQSVLNCLQHDASTTVVSLALTVFIMILPHIPDKLATMLPQSFRILVRLLCWDRLLAVQQRTATFVDIDLPVHKPSQNTEDWTSLDASFDTAHSTPPKCTQLFTFLYGLYPINLMEFLRNPSSVSLGDSAYTDAALDDEVIRSRAVPLIRRHLMHPNFVTLTLETELSDRKQWMKMEPSDVVALCISLDTLSGSKQSMQAESNQGLPHSIREVNGELDNSSRLASPAFGPVVNTTAPVIPELDITTSLPADILEVHEAIQNLRSAQAHDSTQDDHKATAEHYQRESLLLRNELNFERHLKQQHLQHIGRLQRSNISDAAVETERQNLYNTTRALKSKVETLEKTLKGLRNEATTGKTNRASYEASLNDRIKRLREDKVNLQKDNSALEIALEQVRGDVANMRVSLGVSEGAALNLRQQLDVLQPEIQATKDLQKNFELLKQRIRDAEVQDIQLKIERERVAEAQSQAKTAEMKLQALKAQFEDSGPPLSEPLPIPTTTPSDSLLAKLQEQNRSLAVRLESLAISQAAALESRTRALERIQELEAETQSLKVSTDHAVKALQANMEKAAATRPILSRTATPLVSSQSSSVRPGDSRRDSTTSNVSSTDAIAHGSRRQDHVFSTADLKSKTTQSAPSTPLSTPARPVSSTVSATPSPVTRKENKSLGGRFRW